MREPLYVLGHSDSELDPGDVSMVVGVARSPRARAQVDIGALDDGRAFDAVVGRFVLMPQAAAQWARSVRLLGMCARLVRRSPLV